MIAENIFRAYDVRGLYPEEVNEESITFISRALLHIWKPGKIIVAHDGRHGSTLLAKRTVEEIMAVGSAMNKEFEVISVGLSTTPMFFFLVNHFNAMGGAMITASHNPKEYNGVKAVGPGAMPISGTEILAKIKENYGE